MIRSILVASACLVAANSASALEPTGAVTGEDAYKAAKAAAGRDADAHVRLALWCEARGMAAERTKHLTLATLIDPKHTAARGLLGMVQHGGKWLSPEAVAQQVQADPAQQARVREYLDRRANAADRADDQMKLALWCEQNELKDQATAHFYRAAQLDPGRELAWRHLGYKKEKGRWAKPEQLAAEKEFAELQAKANKHWKPILEKIRSGLSSKKGEDRAKAEGSLAEVTDPMAVPTIWATFARGDARRQAVAVKLLGQIDAPGASKALAMLAVWGKSPDVSRRAVEILKVRDPRDFAEVLVALIRKPIEYEVRHKAGLNTPGELFVKGADRNLQRFYTPHEMPTFVPQPTDVYRYDANGLPVVSRFLSAYPQLLATASASSRNGPLNEADSERMRETARAALAANSFGMVLDSSNPSIMGLGAPVSPTVAADLTRAGVPEKLAKTIVKTASDNNTAIAAFNPFEAQGGHYMGPLYATAEQRMEIPLERFLVDCSD